MISNLSSFPISIVFSISLKPSRLEDSNPSRLEVAREGLLFKSMRVGIGIGIGVTYGEMLVVFTGSSVTSGDLVILLLREVLPSD